MTPRDEFDPLAPQREAAMFYGLFLRGHSPETLRRDIDVPKVLLEKWLSPRRLYGPRKRRLGRALTPACRFLQGKRHRRPECRRPW